MAAAIRPSFDSWRQGFLNHESYSTGSEDLDKVLEQTTGYILFQENLMQYFEWLGVTPAESIGLIKKISKKKIHPDDFKNLESRIRSNWIKQTGSEDMFDETWNMIQSCMSYGFCVSGDTKLLRNGNVYKFYPTIAEMYNIMNDYKYSVSTGHKSLHSKYIREGYGKALSLFSDGFLHENNIVDIFYMGKQLTYEVKTKNGKCIRCTKEHKFPTPNGEKMLSELSVGDILYNQGCYQDRENCYWLSEEGWSNNYPKLGEQGFQRKQYSPSVFYENVRKNHVKNKDVCEECGAQYNSEYDVFELHHIDLNRKNNDIENLKWLCNSCHKKIHYQNNRNKRYQRGITIIEDTIISIEEYGVEDVYNVEMDSPAHNFTIDNGLITSNCSAHAAATSLDMCYGAYLKVNYPFEYYSVCFNNYSDDAVRTAKLTKELEYFNISLSDIKFRHSKSMYTYDKENRMIYKGMASIKYLNATSSDELFEIGKNDYKDFIDLLIAIKEISINSKQLDILIKLDFFSEFGEINTLLKQTEIFSRLYGKKQIKTDKLDELEIPIAIISKVAKKQTEKMFKDFDSVELIRAICAEYKYPKTSIVTKIQYQRELYGYIQLTIPNIGKEYYYIQNIDGKYANKTIKLYHLKDGKTIEVKCKKKTLEENPINPSDIIKAYEITEEKKWGKTPEGEWYRKEETELILKKYSYVR